MNNKEIAEIFWAIADILEIKDENFFRIRAYRRAAQNIENIADDINVLAREQRLNIPGVGADLARKIKELVETGRLAYFETLSQSLPAGLLQIMTIPGVGPKTTKLLYEQLKIDSVDALEKAAKNHEIAGLFGLKEKTEENILKGIALIRQSHEKILLPEAMRIAGLIIADIKKVKEAKQISIAGSLRRQKETVRDIDILVGSNQPQKVTDAFMRSEVAAEVLARGATKSAIRTHEGIQVDMRVVAPDSFGAALVYFTGSKEHNIRIRELAKKKKLKINEYGVFEEEGGRCLAGRTEEDVYRILGLVYIEPELREDTREVEAAAAGKLPKLIKLKDVRGDLHVHSHWSDGTASIAAMAAAAQAKGYEYMVISDHSQWLGVAKGLTPGRLAQQKKEIEALNKKLKNFTILRGTEVDIKSDGTLDFADDVLSGLDIVLAAIHSGFKQSREQITERLVKAMQNPYVNIIVHPSGRLINERAAYDFDFEAVLNTAKKTNTALEVNCYPKRLDLDDRHVRKAKEAGVLIALGTDSHAPEQFNSMCLGVSVARRGWLEKKDVLNCLSCKELRKRIKKWI
ncbi:MAG: DNA polymerase/3'-5' exonuclease PolX [Candidatus Omnitrophica bacterium]|nr:DNA polymerase/3'-5' exonuclease PolX [Candidatus Omnitrophota bacterium]